MGRGQEAIVGTTRVSKNGYSYTKVLDAAGKPGWKLTHWIIAEEKLGRPLADDERVVFIKSHTDLSPANIKVVKRDLPPLDRQINKIQDKIVDLQDQLDGLLEQKKDELKSV